MNGLIRNTLRLIPVILGLIIMLLVTGSGWFLDAAEILTDVFCFNLTTALTWSSVKRYRERAELRDEHRERAESRADDTRLHERELMNFIRLTDAAQRALWGVSPGMAAQRGHAPHRPPGPLARYHLISRSECLQDDGTTIVRSNYQACESENCEEPWHTPGT